MSDRLSRKEQWGIVAVLALICCGIGVRQLLRYHASGNDVIAVEGQGHWRKLQDITSTDPAPAAAGTPAAVSESAHPAPAPAVAAPAGGAPAGAVELNSADTTALEGLPGIGPAKAAAILATRTRLGGFKSVDQLDDVPGIGPKTLDRLRPLVVVAAGAQATTSTSMATAATPPPASARQVALATPAPAAAAPGNAAPADRALIAAQLAPLAGAGAPMAGSGAKSKKSTLRPAPASININTASAAELDALPGIGPALAARIVAERQVRGPFGSANDLQRVSGIGPAKLRQMLPYVIVR